MDVRSPCCQSHIIMGSTQLVRSFTKMFFYKCSFSPVSPNHWIYFYQYTKAKISSFFRNNPSTHVSPSLYGQTSLDLLLHIIFISYSFVFSWNFFKEEFFCFSKIAFFFFLSRHWHPCYQSTGHFLETKWLELSAAQDVVGHHFLWKHYLHWCLRVLLSFGSAFSYLVTHPQPPCWVLFFSNDLSDR